MKPLFCLMALLVQQTEVRNAELGFGFRIPPDYQPVTPLPKGLDYGWRRPLPSGQEGALALTVVVLPAALGRDAGDVKITRENLAKKHPTVAFDLRTLKWKDLDLVAVVRELDIPGVGAGISWTAQVPTAPRAIQFTIVGPLGQRDQVEADFQKFLQGVTGKTNWIPTRRRWLLLFTGGFMLLGWSVWAIYGIVWAVLYRKHPERATRARAVCLGVVALALSLGLSLSLLLEGIESDTPNLAPQLFGALAALSAGTRSTKLWNWKQPLDLAPPPMP